MQEQSNQMEGGLESVFDRIVIISLLTRADRRAEITAELRRLHLTPGQGNVRFFDAIRPDSPGEFESIGARGCFLSHLSVLQEALDDGIGRLLILEDDAIFGRDVHGAIARIDQDLGRPDWSMFYGGYNLLRSDGLEDSQGFLVEIDSTDPVQTTHCVGFQGEVIGELVHYLSAMLPRPANSPEGGPMHVDGAYSWFRAAHPSRPTWVAHPKIAFQRPSKSDIIEEERWYDRLPAISKIVTRLRRLKRWYRNF
ncbi:MAG: glycosyltransferase family 25 protein [Pseudomonadota bacterium]